MSYTRVTSSRRWSFLRCPIACLDLFWVPNEVGAEQQQKKKPRALPCLLSAIIVPSPTSIKTTSPPAISTAPPSSLRHPSLVSLPSAMAENLEIGHFRLPSELLDAALFVAPPERTPAEDTDGDCDDKEDYLAGLARRMAQSFLQDDDDETKVAKPRTPPKQEDDARYLFDEMKGELDGSIYHGQLPRQSRRPCPGSHFLALHHLQAARVRFFHAENSSSPSTIFTDLLDVSFQTFHLRQQLPAAWKQSRARREASHGRTRRGGVHGAPLLQMQDQRLLRAGMRTVFLHGSGARRESTGTGVFLPRTTASMTESRKKIDVYEDRRKPEAAAMATPLSCLPQEWSY
ncbi:hypothetical protein Cni_G17150 [Canna indica]|uniref:Uncharacterized protein n=1 Tax=Canna indica TaxID=4628 RepID=A0AAQ3KGT2_9LILI|nr:hypothetical protein Cni_G17150 [Canna indica]